jgi:hypothetical protein
MKPLAKRYRGIKGVIDFARTLGATRSLVPDRTTTSNHPKQRALWADYGYGARWGNSTNVDWAIQGLEQLLARRDPSVFVPLAQPSIAASNSSRRRASRRGTRSH